MQKKKKKNGKISLESRYFKSLGERKKMRNKKKMIALAIVLMSIGFAAVSTTLYLNGQTNIASNNADFDVYFSKTIENGVENNALIQDKTHLTFTTELNGIDNTYVLNYDVTNGSKQYDANLEMNCTGGNEYLRVENKFNITRNLKARETRSGTLTLTVLKSTLEDVEVTISCEIRGNAIEREEAGGETIEAEQVDYLLPTEFGLNYEFIIEKFGSYEEALRLGETCSSDASAPGCTEYADTMANFDQEFAEWGKTRKTLWSSIDKTKIEKITFKETTDVPEGVEGIDVSSKQNKSIMAYTQDEDQNGMLELFVGQDGGVNLNPNSSDLFDEFTEVTEIKGLEKLDTSKVTIMDYMFASCSSLTTLDLSSFNTSKVTNMWSMFYDCSSLTTLDVSSFDTSNVPDMSHMFQYCSSLTNLDINSFDTSKVTNMEYMFGECTSLTTLDLSSFDTSKVTNMRYMFYSCRSLTTLDLSRFDTSNVTSMFRMFENCSSLISLDLSKFDTSNVTTMHGMFDSCSSLTSLDLSSFNTSNVTNMNGMFSGCSSLTTLDVSSFDTSKVTDMNGMFSSCSKLSTTITIRGTKCTEYINMFLSAATESGAQITINYTEDASTLVNQMIATKSSNSNVVKGSVVA